MTGLYSRSFYPVAEEKAVIPNNYDGTAFSEVSAQPTQTHDSFPDDPSESCEKSRAPQPKEDSVLSFLGLPKISSLFGGSIKMPRLGGEEILIIATAAFLFFSKEGDKECALLLLALLFIS